MSNLVAEGAEIVVKAVDDYGNVAEEMAEEKYNVLKELPLYGVAPFDHAFLF